MRLDLIKIESLDGVGSKMAVLLRKKNINTARDIIYFFPNRYNKYEVVNIKEVQDDTNITTLGTIIKNPINIKTKNNLHMTTFIIDSFGEFIKIVIFNRKYLEEKLNLGMKVYVYGKYQKANNTIMANNIFFKLNENTMEPIYSDIGIPNKVISKIIIMAIKKFGNLISEDLPQNIIDKYQLVSLYKAINYLHQPKNDEEIKMAIRRMKYEEIFKFLLKLNLYKRNIKKIVKRPKKYDIDKVREYIDTIPFELTDDQKKVTNEIFIDLKKPYPANRLIQGDVGSGKTIVSSIAIYATYTSGYQIALMAPTEMLAIQHYESLKNYLGKNIQIDLITSNTKIKEKERIKSELKSGKIDLLIGTHSLIQNDVLFNNLGLVIIDEQHRFGVEQRSKLIKKGLNVDAIYLTATPIPRTLAISIFGDLDISSIHTMPQGRKKVITKYINKKEIESCFTHVKEELKKKHQVYMVAPIVNESEKMDLINANKLYEMVSKYFKEEKVSLLYGNMDQNDKEKVIKSFKENETSILVSTTVIEVGIDIKNATIMVIFDAHRFGLSQLHQLRGRVGRNGLECYCYLVSDENVERLKILEKTNDGFLLSEEDLKLRGPGDFFGVKQSGLPKFSFIDLSKDINVITCARDDVTYILDNDLLGRNGYQKLHDYLLNDNIFKGNLLN